MLFKDNKREGGNETTAGWRGLVGYEKGK